MWAGSSLDLHGHGTETSVTYMRNTEVVKMEMVCLLNLGVPGESLMCNVSWMNQLRTMLRRCQRKQNASLNHASMFSDYIKECFFNSGFIICFRFVLQLYLAIILVSVLLIFSCLCSLYCINFCL